MTNTPSITKYRAFYFLAMFYISTDLVSKVVAYRFLEFDAIFFTSATFVFPLTYVIVDIITEVYGYTLARQVFWYGFICDFWFAVAVTLSINIHTTHITANQSDYDYVFGNIIRFSIAAAAAAIFGQFSNMYFLAKWKILTHGRYFWLRSIGASAIGELFILVIAIFVAFYGEITFINTIKMICSAYIYKMVCSILLAGPAQMIATHLKNNNANFYDVKTNFNPFKV